MTTDFRALITRMANELDGYRQMLLDNRTVTHQLSNEARAALADGPAAPEGREPASVTGQPSDEALYDYWISTSPEFGCADPVGFARAVLARWGTPNFAETRSSLGDAPQPVPVSERLPEPKDCDAEGRCWVWWKNGVRWVLDEWTHHELREGLLSDYVSHWLPAHAIPIPTAND